MYRIYLRTFSGQDDNCGLDLGVVDLTESLLQVILRCHAELVRVQEVEPKLNTMTFWNHACSYVEADVDELLEAIGGVNHFEDHGWVAMPAGFAPPEFEERYVDLDRMVVDAQSVWWSCYPHNIDVEVSTERIAVARIRELGSSAAHQLEPSPR